MIRYSFAAFLLAAVIYLALSPVIGKLVIDGRRFDIPMAIAIGVGSLAFARWKERQQR